MNKEFIKVLATILGTEIVDGVEVIKLVPLSEFVKTVNCDDGYSLYCKYRNTDQVDSYQLEDILDYTNFITQQLTKGQFVPCGEDGEVVEKPKDHDKWISYNNEGLEMFWSNETEHKTYQQAQDRVLFINDIDLNNGYEVEFLRCLCDGTIEQAINNGIELYLKQ